jgi:hypothetical protein
MSNNHTHVNGVCTTAREAAETFKQDRPRLHTQLEQVKQLMQPGAWFTLARLALKVAGSEAGVSARLRDLRKPPHNLLIERRRVAGEPNLWEYTAHRPQGAK